MRKKWVTKNVLSRKLLAASAVMAICTIATDCLAETYTVGAGGAEANCTFDSIQQALTTAAEHEGYDEIWIANNLSYTAQQLVVGQQDLAIIGGFANCKSEFPDPNAQTTISGVGAQGPVFKVVGSGVRTFHNLFITGGANSGDGGGIAYIGSGAIGLFHTSVVNNRARQGGGISAYGQLIAGDLSKPTVIVGKDVVIANNDASLNGGGIYLDTVDLEMKEPALVALNSAGEEGGGVFVGGGSDATIWSRGFLGLPPIYGNDAARGGGLAVRAFKDSSAFLAVDSDPDHPVEISQNIARDKGGGLYIRDYAPGAVGFNNAATALLNRYAFRGNQAPDGAAIYAKQDGSKAFITFGNKTGSHCGSIDSGSCVFAGNIVTAAGGAIITLEGGSLLKFQRPEREDNARPGFIATDNAGGAFVKSIGAGASNQVLPNCLIHRNETEAADLITLQDSASVELHNCTVANNVIGSHKLVYAEDQASKVIFSRTIVDQPADDLVFHPSGVPSTQVALTENLFWLANLAGGDTIVAMPRFVDPAFGDYRLRPGSLAIDAAWDQAAPGGPKDFEGASRPVNMQLKPDWRGTHDIGAFEAANTANLVANGEFNFDLRAWSVAPTSPPIAILDAWDADSVYQIYGKNSVRVTLDPGSSITELDALSQEVFVPAPGFYSLDALALTDSVLSDELDRPYIKWQLYADSPTCSGAPLQQGEMEFKSSSGRNQWSSRQYPAVISVPADIHTESTCIKLTLGARKSGQAESAEGEGIYALFDRISLELVGGPGEPQPLLRDGFE